MNKDRQSRPRHFISVICHRHHFANPNTADIIFSLLFLGVIYRLLSFLGREGKY